MNGLFNMKWLIKRRIGDQSLFLTVIEDLFESVCDVTGGLEKRLFKPPHGRKKSADKKESDKRESPHSPDPPPPSNPIGA